MLLDGADHAFSMTRTIKILMPRSAVLMAGMLLIGIFASLQMNQADAAKICISEHIHGNKYKHLHYDYCKPGQPLVPPSLDKPCKTEHIHQLGAYFELHYHDQNPCIQYKKFYDGGYVDTMIIKFKPQDITQANDCSSEAGCTNTATQTAPFVVPSTNAALVIVKLTQEILQANFCDNGATCQNVGTQALTVSGGKDKFLIFHFKQIITQVNVCYSDAQCANLAENAVGLVFANSGDIIKIKANQDIIQVNLCDDANCSNGATQILKAA
jgi:hypothetical protein